MRNNCRNQGLGGGVVSLSYTDYYLFVYKLGFDIIETYFKELYSGWLSILILCVYIYILRWVPPSCTLYYLNFWPKSILSKLMAELISSLPFAPTLFLVSM